MTLNRLFIYDPVHKKAICIAKGFSVAWSNGKDDYIDEWLDGVDESTGMIDSTRLQLKTEYDMPERTEITYQPDNGKERRKIVGNIEIGMIVNYLMRTGVTRPAIITYVHNDGSVNLTVFGCESDGAEVKTPGCLKTLTKVTQGTQACTWSLYHES